jgi:acyl-coenzyme A synthetase/AMP-(fatty) acid ligase
MRPCITAPSFQGTLPSPRFNIGRQCLAAQARRIPDKTALLIVRDPADARGDEIWTYARLDDAVRRFAAVLIANGVNVGDRVLVRLGNSANAAIAFLGANAAGAVPIPVSSQLTATEVEYLAEDSGARLVVVAPDLPVGRACDGRAAIAEPDMARLAGRHEPVAYTDTAADDPGFLIYTSGTTSRPKGVLHAQRALWGRRPMYEGWYAIRTDDVVLHAGALNWTYTLGTGFMDPLVNSATAVIFAGERAPDVWPDLIERVSATLFAAVPTVYRQILKYCNMSPNRIPSLRHGLTAGEALRPEIAEGWYGHTGRRLYEAFGMSEISTYVSSAPTVPPRPGSPGRPQQGRAVALLPVDEGVMPVMSGDAGVIAIHRSDPGLMLGYWNRAEEPELRGDWFVTGDLAMMDEDVYLWPKGRADDLMNVQGYRVSPVEVEEAVAAHPDVSEAAAVAVEVRPGVSIIKAFVVAEAGVEIDPADVLASAGQRLAGYKMPREIVQISALPRTANGKVRRDALRDSSS